MPWTIRAPYGAASKAAAPRLSTARVPSDHGLLTTVAYQVEGEAPIFALEGSVAIAGAGVQWLRDNLGIISGTDEVKELASSAPDNGDVYFVPAFSGLFAPHWRADARGVIAGLTRFADKRHIARAVLESVAYRFALVADLLLPGVKSGYQMIASGGAIQNSPWWLQTMADVLGVPVGVSAEQQDTSRGTAILALNALGVWDSLDTYPAQIAETYEPNTENTQIYGEARERQSKLYSKLLG